MTSMAEHRLRALRERDIAVHEHLVAVTDLLTDDLGRIARQTRDAVALRIPELAEPDLHELLRASVEGDLVTLLHAVRHGIPGDRLGPPAAALELSRRLARRGVDAATLARTYRLCQQTLLRRLFEASRSVGGDEAVRAEVYGQVVEEVFDHVDRISQQVAIAYDEERASCLVHQSRTGEAQVRRVLEGGDLDIGIAEQAISYRLLGHHVAVVASLRSPGGDGDPEEDRLTRCTRAVRELAAEVGGGVPLVVSPDNASVWAWIPVSRDWRLDERWTAPALDAHGSEPVLALGSCGEGVDGFRTSHEQALRVHRLASLGGMPDRTVVSNDERGLAVTALLAQDVPAARAWIRDVLGDLLGEDESLARLRFTLLTLLRHDLNYTSTAQAMIMHKNSIRYRALAAEALLGHPVVDRRLDLEIALTACAWLGSGMEP